MRLRHGWRVHGFALSVITALLVWAAPAYATNCNGLQAALDGAAAGDTVTLNEGSHCAGPFTLPPRAITLQGGGLGAFIDGVGTRRALVGTDVGATTIRHLTIQNTGSDAQGGGISITGDSTPTFEDVNFFRNHADGPGGAIAVTSTATTGAITISHSNFGDGTSADGNTAGTDGGGAYIESAGAAVVVDSAKFDMNTADVRGGGLAVRLLGDGATLTISGSLITSNAVMGAGASDGGGAFIEGAGVGQTVTMGDSFIRRNSLVSDGTAPQVSGGGLSILGTGSEPLAVTLRNNALDENSIQDSPSLNVGVDRRGGALYVAGGILDSRYDQFLRDSISATAPGGSVGGVGASMSACAANGGGVVDNDVFAGGHVNASADGVGLHVYCHDGDAALTMRDTTVSGNSATGGTAGLWGASGDSVTVVNSILYGNSPGANLTGFATRKITFSDACVSGLANICTDPLLVDPTRGDIHQTVKPPISPTINRGSAAAVPSYLKTDVDSDPRIDGPTVDMGADETVNVFSTSGGPPNVFTAPPPDLGGPAPAQIVAGVRVAAKPKRKCGDHTGPTSRFLNRLATAARFKGTTQLVIRGKAKYVKCKSQKTKGKIKRVLFTIKRVVGNRCSYVEKNGRFGPLGNCRKHGAMFVAKGTTNWSFTLRQPLESGRYLAQVQAVDNLGNKERASTHRNFRHFRIEGHTLRQGWNGTHPDDYTVRG